MQTKGFKTLMTSACVSALILSGPAAPTFAVAQLAPDLSAEGMMRLRTQAMNGTLTSRINPELARLFGIVVGPEGFTAKQLRIDIGQSTHLMAFSLQRDSDDIILTRQDPGITYFFLTDSSRTLRAAGILDATGSRLVTIEQAQENYTVVLGVWGSVANPR